MIWGMFPEFLHLHLHEASVNICQINKFTRFYTYTNVNEYHTLTLTQNVNKFHYGIYT
jgi:hypothetical protein